MGKVEELLNAPCVPIKMPLTGRPWSYTACLHCGSNTIYQCTPVVKQRIQDELALEEANDKHPTRNHQSPRRI